MSDLLKSRLKSIGIKLSDVAGKLEVDKSRVTRWSQGRVPATRVLEVERVTGIPRHELRPDLYPADPSQRGEAAA